ncbi:hypothetical protein BH23BAC4_BH23BAC4_10850 [soil metagenome]
MKRACTPVEVVQDGERLREIYTGQHCYRVNLILEAWVVEGRWWAAEERREYVRVQTEGPVLELYLAGGQWRIAKVCD